MIDERKPPSSIRRRVLAEPGTCVYCDMLREDGESFAPYHDASANCPSGQREHCSCSICF